MDRADRDEMSNRQLLCFVVLAGSVSVVAGELIYQLWQSSTSPMWSHFRCFFQGIISALFPLWFLRARVTSREILRGRRTEVSGGLEENPSVLMTRDFRPLGILIALCGLGVGSVLTRPE